MKRIKRLSFKSLSAVMAVILTVLSVQITAFAGLISADKAINTSAPINEVFEIVDMRTADAKYFHLPDGSYYLAQYDTDVHYQDENGKWQDIDNTLTASGSEISTSNAKIKFVKKTGGNSEIFTLHDGNTKLTLTMNGAEKKVEGQITNHQSQFGDGVTELQKMTTLDKINASVLYEDIMSGVDLEYIVNGLNVKENIIVKEKTDSYVYSFTMKLNNLEARANQNGGIDILSSDGSEIVYIIPAPVMWDAEYTYSDRATMSLEDGGNGKYTITVTADSEWMNDGDRVFPVTIDPPIYSGTSSSVLDLYVSSSGTYDSTTLQISNTSYTYWKIDPLPTLPNAAYITDATFSMARSDSSTASGYVGAFGVETSWNSSLSWSNAQQYLSDSFTDYQLISSEDGSATFYNWNITPIVSSWYKGNNYGVAFAPITSETFTGTISFYSDSYSTSYLTPQLCITYVDMKGLEDYWSYTSQGAGFAGTGSVNNATGNLVFTIPTLTTTDALMPITPTLVYQSSLADQGVYYPNAQVAFGSMHTPLGSRLNIAETLIEKSYTNAGGEVKNLYIWSDGDGTEHYFMPTATSTTVFTDEDGLLLTLTKEDSSITITDSGNNIRRFSECSGDISDIISRWYLTELEDISGNKVVISYNSNYQPTSLSLKPYGQTAIEQMRFLYDSYSMLYAVYNPTSSDGVVLRYSNTESGSLTTTNGKYLRKIIHAHGGTTDSAWSSFYNSGSIVTYGGITVDATADYTYSGGKLTTAVNGLTGYKITYNYDSASRVNSISESVSGTAGQAVTLTYNSSFTVIRTSGADDVLNTSDDLLTTYSFDTSGRAVSCYTTDLTGENLYGASNGQYVDEDNEKAKNNLKSSVQTAQQSSNFLLNGGFENKSSVSSMSNWTTGGSFGLGVAHSGENCAGLCVTSTVSRSYVFQDATLDAGDYALGLYLSTYDAYGANVKITVQALEGDAYYTQSLPVNDVYASGGYMFIQLPFTVEYTELYRVYIELSKESGATVSEDILVCLDSVMLSRTQSGIENDIVSGGHFESSSAASSYWTTTNGSAVTVVASGNALHNDVLKITPSLSSSSLVRQTVYSVSDTSEYYHTQQPMMFTVSLWGKGTAQAFNNSSLFGVKVEVHYYDGTASGAIDEFEFAFNKSLTDWQFLSGGFVTDATKGMVDRITVYIQYTGHSGIGYFDGVSVVRDDSSTSIIDYNENGYPTTHRSGKNATYYSYDVNNNVKWSVSSDKTAINYNYDNRKRVIKETVYKHTGSFAGFSTSTDAPVYSDGTQIQQYYSTYSYNSFGLMTTSQTTDTTGSILYTAYGYDTGSSSHIFGVMTSEENSLGEITRYFYNSTNGLLMAVIYPDGNGVSYSYDAMGNITEVLPATLNTAATGYNANSSGASVAYTYDSVTKRLSTITTESTAYTFVYDVFGNTDTISAGGYLLANYEYNTNNGKLNLLEYGNGLKVKYTYDALDRIEKIEYNSGTGGAYEARYGYTYDGNGRLSLVTDYTTGEVTHFVYDSAGRITRTVVYDSAEYKNLYGASVIYDDQSRVSYIDHTFDYSVSSSFANATVTYGYTYSETNGLISAMSISAGTLTGSISPVYDSFGRLSTKTTAFTVSSTSAFYNKHTYAYVTSGTRTSARVSQYKSEVGVSSSSTTATTYNYTYDANGNITQITNASGVVQNKYYYDSLGQLTREDNLAKNKTYVWTYDNAGNRTSQKTYAYTTGTLGTVQSTQSYTYGNSTWGDLLTYTGGYYVEYDGIGNPTKIYQDDGGYQYGYLLTWEGRKLISYSEFDDYGSGEEIYSTISYTYNDEGIRTSKNVNGTEHTYLLNGSQIIAELWSTHMLVYVYDEAGTPIGIKYRSTSYAEGVFDHYFFDKNLQGDIVAIYNASGTKIGTYTYDAWGNITQSTLSTNTVDRFIVSNNPFRYRGYYYDTDTTLYYLQSRYYKASWGRFLNADEHISTGKGLLGYNMYAYCCNSPLFFRDDTGNFPWAVVIGVIVVVAAIGLDHYLASNYPDGANLIEDINGDDLNERILYGKGSGFGVEDGEVTLCDLEVGTYSGVAEYESGRLSLITLLTATVSAKFDCTDTLAVELSGIASIYTMFGEYTLSIGDIDITISGALHVGAIGAEAKFDFAAGEFSIAPPTSGILPSYGINIDYKK